MSWLRAPTQFSCRAAMAKPRFPLSALKAKIRVKKKNILKNHSLVSGDVSLPKSPYQIAAIAAVLNAAASKLVFVKGMPTEMEGDDMACFINGALGEFSLRPSCLYVARMPSTTTVGVVFDAEVAAAKVFQLDGIQFRGVSLSMYLPDTV